MVKKKYTEDGEQLKMKKSFIIDKKLEPFYTGGAIALSPNEKYLFCQCEHMVKVVDIATGQAISCYGDEEDAAITVCGTDDVLFTAHRTSHLIKQWSLSDPGGALVRSFKGHPVPVTSLSIDPSSSLLASGATDSVIRVWDVDHHYCTHQFKGSRGVVTLLAFHPTRLHLLSSSDDLLIKVWDLASSSLLRDLRGHVSPVTSLLFRDEDTCISAGRDKVLIRWCLGGAEKETTPVFEVVEGIALVKGRVVTAGDKGVLRAWDLADKKCVLQQDPPALKREYVKLFSYKGGVLGVTFDQNILIFNEELQLQKNLIGYNDEIIDVKPAFEGHLALATNSEQIRLINTASLATTVLTGHTGTVLAIDTNPHHGLLASGSKDTRVGLWRQEGASYTLLTALTGHTGAVSGVALCRLPDNVFVVSVSSDLTLKLWQPAKNNVAKLGRTKCVYTVKAHEKDINCVTVSPNDKLIITGSLDKTGKVWSVDKGALLGTLRGHRRGVWAARFSPADQCVLTSSGDALVKLWSLSDYTCLRTYEGHSSSVLNVQFLTAGRQVVSCCADGLIKVWNTQTAECTTTLDGHGDKCWALAATEEGLVSGAADSLLCFWRDVTEEEEEKEVAEERHQSQQQQEFRNLLFSGRLAAALALSLSLNMPYKCLTVAEKILELEDGAAQLRSLIEDLQVDQIETLLGYVASWNTNARHTVVSQTVLFATLSSKQHAALADNPRLRVHWEALMPYTERHLERLNKLQQQATFLQYTWDRMKLSQV